ncbi:MAG: hypothetical protein HJJLKODD_02866 [Phycisphaerae bacterium]|nr:hypothetical protein [Phycisphaerae bacterium]
MFSSWRYTILMVLGLLPISCSGEGQNLDLASFNQFSFSRVIELPNCFEPGDLYTLSMNQGSGITLTFTLLVATDTEGATCIITTTDGVCLVESEPFERVLTEDELAEVTQQFQNIEIAREPDELCGSGNVTLCSEDTFQWDGVRATTDFCQPVYLRNAFEVMSLLEELRDATAGTQQPSGT